MTDRSMRLPKDWQGERWSFEDGHAVGHEEGGGTIAIHSLAVLPEHQGKQVGSTLMKSYIHRIREAQIADRIAIIAHDHLIPFYESFGFESRGPSKCQFGGGGWVDLVRSYTSFLPLLPSSQPLPISTSSPNIILISFISGSRVWQRVQLELSCLYLCIYLGVGRPYGQTLESLISFVSTSFVFSNLSPFDPMSLMPPLRKSIPQVERKWSLLMFRFPITTRAGLTSLSTDIMEPWAFFFLNGHKGLCTIVAMRCT